MDLKLQWIPSHIGLLGNEEADILTNRTAMDGENVSIKPNYTENLSKFKVKCWEKSADKGIWYRTMQSEPPRIPWFIHAKLNRQLLVTLRIRSGHIPLKNLGFLMKKLQSPNCLKCNKPEDIQHIFYECTQNKSRREALMEGMRVKALDVGILQSILAEPASEQAKRVYAFVNASLQNRM